MIRYLFVFFIGVLLFDLHGAVNAQSELKHFSNISVDKGLSQNTVYAITQDPLGFMWMGTQDGLNRYDGKSFISYKPVKGASQSLASFYIRYLFTDTKGRLWIGGNGGVSTYDYNSNSFKNYNIQPRPGEWYVSCIVEDRNGGIWVATNSGEIYKSDAAYKAFQPLSFSMPSGKPTPIYALSFLNDRSLLLGTETGLLILDPGTGAIKKLDAGVGEVRINQIFSDGSFVWVGTEGKGLVKIHRQNRTATNYTRQTGQLPGLVNDNVRSINKDSKGDLWIGTFRGLSIMDQQGVYQNYHHELMVPKTLSQNSVRCIYKDRQGGMWLGTFYGGVNYYHSQLTSFNLLNQSSGTPKLRGNVVNVIKEDAKGGFWIGMEGEGLNYWDPGKKIITYIGDQENGGKLSSGSVKSIALDGDLVFVGTHNEGLNVLDLSSGSCKIYKHNSADPGSISGNMVYALLKDHAGGIWVGTRTGLDLFDKSQELFVPFRTDKNRRSLSSDEITYLMQDSRKRVWIGTINGVNVFNTVTQQLEPVSNEALSNDVINFIAEDPRGRIWIGTRDGLNLFDERRHSFINPELRADFMRGNINSIVPDASGNLWVTQNAGLVKYSPDTRQAIYFEGATSLQNVQFNVYASCRAKDGMLLFGGVNGISYFYPLAIDQKPSVPGIVFTGLEVFNKIITPGDGTDIINRHINEAGSVHFNHEQKQFTILFNSFDYLHASTIRYLYKLEGFDNDWQQAGDLPRASYSNLQPGNYTFKVKAIGGQGEQSPERSLAITVTPVWYKANWFYVLVVIAAACLAFFLYRILTERMRAMHQLKLERLQREKVNYINKVKMDFFTNISHELRTPLTLIMAPLEEILNQPATDKKLRRSHELMMRNTRRLYNIVNQLFEFKKTEMGTRQLRVGRRDLTFLVRDVYKSFIPFAEKKNINYDLEMSTGELVFLSDREAVEHILFNLLSNAFKYTSVGQTITIRLDRTDTHAIIKVIDTGKGMGREHLTKIFERFYQVDGQEMNLGSGVGLAFTRRLVELHHGVIEVDSEPGKGSSFTVTLPLADEMYEGDLLVDDVDTGQAVNAADYAAESIYPVEELGEHIHNSGEQPDTLLIVDDNREIVSYLKEYFSGTYHVLTAHNGKEALSIIEDTQPVAIISDIMMPEMDGLHFCKKIKQNIQTSHIPVLLLTAKSETDQQLKGLEMGADDYITKPFSISVLEARLQNLLKARKRLRDFYASGREIEPEQLTFNDLDQEFLEKAIKIIEANLDEYDFSVEKLSRELGMSRSNLYLKVKAITGESVTALIKRIRLKKAAGLLEQRKYTVAEIAYMCGFNTPSYFSTAFKQFYGYMPTEYLDRKDADKE